MARTRGRRPAGVSASSRSIRRSSLSWAWGVGGTGSSPRVLCATADLCYFPGTPNHSQVGATE